MPRRGSDFNQRDAQQAIRVFAQLPRKFQIAVIVLIVVGVIVYFIVQARKQHAPPDATTSASLAANLFLGNPSNAGSSDRKNYLMAKPYFVLSYNNDLGEPNWVSWRLTNADLGTAPRKVEFDGDSTLPAGFVQIISRDYSGSGFDRGHMCPHDDRAANLEMSYATFVMTNIIPQAKNLNEKAWAEEENYLRRIVKQGHRLYIQAGPLGRGGVGLNGPTQTVADGRVSVPSGCWKIAVVSDQTVGDDDMSQITDHSRVIAVIMPNDNNRVGFSWGQYRVRPAEIERQTGFHFFDKLNASVRSSLDKKLDEEPVEGQIHSRHEGARIR